MTLLMTGASGGFGKSATRMFAERGANLVLSDVNEQGLADHAETLKSDGYKVCDHHRQCCRRKPLQGHRAIWQWTRSVASTSRSTMLA